MAPQQKSKNPLKSIISGGITGGIEICITYPTEYIKTQMQLYPQDAKKGIKHIVQQTYHKFGISGFYRGLPALLVFSVPKTAVRFGSNQWFRNNLFTDKNSRLHTFMAGLGAGVTEAILVVTPAETLKVKIINDKLSPNPQFKGFVHGIRTIVAQTGLSGCYKGLYPTIIKQGSNQAVRFLVYEDCKKLMSYVGVFPDVVNMLVAGGMAGAASVFANTPVDVIKTKMQGLEAHKYKGSFDCFVQTFKEGGVKGLYKGTVPRLSRVVLDVAITFTLFDYISRVMDQIWPEPKSI